MSPLDTNEIADKPWSEILEPDEPEPFYWMNRDVDSPVLLSCEHAGFRFPRKVGTLGLTEDQQGKHYCGDIGAEGVTHHMSERLKAPGLLSVYSRAVIDINRPLGHPRLCTTEEDGDTIPDNLKLSAADRKMRIEGLYNPFHEDLSDYIQGKVRREERLLHIMIHSFTPVFQGEHRPWEIAFLWKDDKRLAQKLIDHFSEQGFCVGDNEPYDAHVLLAAAHEHAHQAGLPYVIVEVRNDLIRDEEGQREWADYLSQAIEELFLKHESV